MNDEKAIGADLDLCDLGLALSKGNWRRQFGRHRKACFAAIREMNAADGLDKLTDAEILAALEA